MCNGIGHRLQGAFDYLVEQGVHVELGGVPLVGDTLKDIQAAPAVGATPYLVRTGKGVRTEAAAEGLDGVMIFDNLAACVDHLLSA